jgi:hypothetical protein
MLSPIFVACFAAVATAEEIESAIGVDGQKTAQIAPHQQPTGLIIEADPPFLSVREGHRNQGIVTISLKTAIEKPLNVTVKGGLKPTPESAIFPDLAVFPASWIFMPGGKTSQAVAIVVEDDTTSTARHQARLTWESHTVGMRSSDDSFFDEASAIVLDYHVAGALNVESANTIFDFFLSSWVRALLFGTGIFCLYCVCGCAMNYRRGGQPGWAAVPHSEVWRSLASRGCGACLTTQRVSLGKAYSALVGAGVGSRNSATDGGGEIRGEERSLCGQDLASKELCATSSATYQAI